MGLEVGPMKIGCQLKNLQKKFSCSKNSHYGFSSSLCLEDKFLTDFYKT